VDQAGADPPSRTVEAGLARSASACAACAPPVSTIPKKEKWGDKKRNAEGGKRKTGNNKEKINHSKEEGFMDAKKCGKIAVFVLMLCLVYGAALFADDFPGNVSLVTGPNPVGLGKGSSSRFVYQITLRPGFPRNAYVQDVVPAEFDVAGLSASCGRAESAEKASHNKKGQYQMQPDVIKWNLTGCNNSVSQTLTVTMGTVLNPGHLKRGIQFYEPTGCGPLRLNEGAVLIDAKKGRELSTACESLSVATCRDEEDALCSDADGDGWSASCGDCLDDNPAAHPGAIEICDGVDNNCDGVIDEGCQACCLPTGLCTEAMQEECTEQGGLPKGTGSTCAMAECGTFGYEITDEVKPTVSSLPDPNGGPDRIIAAYQDERGVATDFLADEVIISPGNHLELDTFLQTYGGTIVGDNRVPLPPPELGITMSPEYLIPTEYAVRVTVFPDTANFQTEAWQRGARGFYRFSSQDGVKLLALTTRERLRGMKIQPSWVYYGHHMLHQTEEILLPDGTYTNAMNYYVFHGPDPVGNWDSNRSSIYKAWQYIAASGLDHSMHQSVSLAIIDGGFWLDGAGNLMPTLMGHDLPSPPIQYDFVGDDYIADGENPLACTGGNACPWHGNGSASVAAAFLNNAAAIAGSGGQVAQPYLFKVQTASQARRALRTLIPWQAQIANMSFGGACNDDCIQWKEENEYYQAFQEVLAAGIVLVASAGNNGLDVDVHRYEPCVIPGVICVGALESWVNTAKSYSNYGASVDIWAPTDVTAMPDGDSPNALTTHGGTSASSPLVAGVAAMMKAANPALNSDGVCQILRNTAWKIGTAYSSDPKVQGAGYLDAYTAVLAAAGYTIFEDYLENNDTSGSATPLSPGYHDELTLSPGHSDFYRFTLNDYAQLAIHLEYMRPMGNIIFTLTPETTSNPPAGVSQNAIATGFEYEATMMPPGTYRLALAANVPQYYHMAFSFSETGLLPDQFEPNNSIPTLTPLLTREGSWELNLHHDADVDHFLIQIPAMPVMHYQELGIYNADFPVTVEMFDPSTLDLIGSSTGTEVVFSFQNADVGKYYLIRISGQKTRYVFGYNNKRTDNPWGHILAYDPFWWIRNPGDPYSNPFENILIEREGWIVVTPAPFVGANGIFIDQVNLYAKGLGIRLYDYDENKLILIREGVAGPGFIPGTNDVRTPDETLDTRDLEMGRAYLLQIYRSVGAEDPIDGSVPVLPQMPYVIEAVF
jgi:hypothetical protein